MLSAFRPVRDDAGDDRFRISYLLVATGDGDCCDRRDCVFSGGFCRLLGEELDGYGVRHNRREGGWEPSLV